MTTILLMTLLWLDTTAVNAKYEIPCGRTPTNPFDFWTSPLRGMVSEFLHSGCTGQTENGDFEKLQIATWGQYANLSSNNSIITARIQGYAYSVPKCAFSDQLKRQLLTTLLGFTGCNVSFIADQALMPADFLSYSVAGAEVAVSVGNSNIIRITSTNEYGHFDSFVKLSIPPGIRSAANVRTSNMRITMLACSKSLQAIPTTFKLHLIPSNGLTIVSDVDDILKVSEIWNFKQALLKIFTQPFEPWLDMPTVYADWHRSVQSAHFHYTSDAPEMTDSFYVRGIGEYYPVGTFDFRPMAFDRPAEFFNSRYLHVKRLIETFPNRKLVLVGDTATGSTLSSYVKLAQEHPQQVQCIIMRDVSAIEPANWIVPNLEDLRRLTGRYIIFRTPKDLHGTALLMRALERSSLEQGTNLGCGGLDINTNTHTYGNAISWVLTFWYGLSTYYQCFLLLWHRPHVACRLDRRERIWYHHGGYEPLHDGRELVNNISELPYERPLLTRRTKSRQGEL